MPGMTSRAKRVAQGELEMAMRGKGMKEGQTPDPDDPHAPIVRHPEPDAGKGMFGIPRLLTVPFEETDGSLGIWEKIIDAGQGPPLHSHPDEYEALLVIDGAVEVLCGQTVTRAGTGTVVVVPPGAPHRYRGLRETEPSCLFVMLAPARGGKVVPLHARMKTGDDDGLDMLELPPEA